MWLLPIPFPVLSVTVVRCLAQCTGDSVELRLPLTVSVTINRPPLQLTSLDNSRYQKICENHPVSVNFIEKIAAALIKKYTYSTPLPPVGPPHTQADIVEILQRYSSELQIFHQVKCFYPDCGAPQAVVCIVPGEADRTQHVELST